MIHFRAVLIVLVLCLHASLAVNVFGAMDAAAAMAGVAAQPAPETAALPSPAQDRLEPLRRAVREALDSASTAQDLISGHNRLDAPTPARADFDALRQESLGLERELAKILPRLQADIPAARETVSGLRTLSDSLRDDPLALESLGKSLDQLELGLSRQRDAVRVAGNLILELEQSAMAQPGLAPSAMADIEFRRGLESLRLYLRDARAKVESTLAYAETPLAEMRFLRERISGMLEPSWQRYYLGSAEALFAPSSWRGLGAKLDDAARTLMLRARLELPASAPAWHGLILRVVNALLLGAALLFFLNRALGRFSLSRKGFSPLAPRRRLVRALGLVFLGGALLYGAGGVDFAFRPVFTAGCLIAMWGETCLAWSVRRLNDDAPIGPSPLVPAPWLAVAACALAYTSPPNAVFNTAWFMIGAFALWRMPRARYLERATLERRLLGILRLGLWTGLAATFLGFGRASALFTVALGCLLVTAQLVIALMHRIEVAARSGGIHAAVHDMGGQAMDEPTLMGQQGNGVLGELFSGRAVAGVLAAFAAPFALAFIPASVLLWASAMPGGGTLLRMGLSAGVTFGTFSIDALHIALVVSLFYLTRAGLAAMRGMFDRLGETRRIDANLLPALNAGITYGLWTLFGLAALRAFGFGLANLAIVAGGLSVGIGFGMQNIVNNFISGLILIFSRTLHEGDIIEVGNLQGIVRRISIRATVVETFDNAVIFVPNAEFIANRLVNWTRNGRLVRREITIGVAYGTDPDLARHTLVTIARMVPDVAANPEPSVLITNFGESAITFSLRYWADISVAAGTASAIRAEILRVFAEKRISIAFPQLDVRLTSMRDEARTAAPVSGQAGTLTPSGESGPGATRSTLCDQYTLETTGGHAPVRG